VSWLELVSKGRRVNFVEDFFIQTFHQRNENINDENPTKKFLNVIYDIKLNHACALSSSLTLLLFAWH
jgi:hypothetical protein